MTLGRYGIRLGCVGETAIYMDIMMLPALVLMYMMGGLGFALIFLPVFAVHELSHILAAKLFEYNICTLELMPIGGRMHISDLCGQRTCQICALYAFAPFVNGSLFCLLYAVGIKWSSLLCTQLAFANAAVAAINLLPLFPLDGGNIVRALLNEKMTERQSLLVMLWANIIFTLLAVASAVVCFLQSGEVLWQPVALGAFLLASVIKERKSSTSNVMAGILAKDRRLKKQSAMPSNCVCVRLDSTIGQTLKHARANCINEFMVADEDMTILGRLTEKELVDGAVRHGMAYLVGELVGKKYPKHSLG